MTVVAGAIWLAAMQAAATTAPTAAPTARMPGTDHAAAPCPATPAPPPAELAGWSRMAPVAAGASAGAATALTLGASVRAALLPTARVAYPLPPEKPGGATSSGGLFGFAVPAAGRYRIALGSPAWIDVVRDGKPVASAAHAHGPACSGVRKMIDFDLKPGRYWLQVAGSEAASLPLMVVRLQ